MDGRAQLPVIKWIKDNSGVDYVDMITEAGMVGVLADEIFIMDDIMRKIDISINAHGSQDIFIAGHHDCAGNPVTDELHQKQIASAVLRLKKLYPSSRVSGLWVSSTWSVEIVT